MNIDFILEMEISLRLNKGEELITEADVYYTTGHT